MKRVMRAISMAVSIMLTVSALSSCGDESGNDGGGDAAVSHMHEYVLVYTDDADCENNGVKYYECPCGQTYTEEITPLGHEYGVYVYNNDSTCTRNGTETAKCIRCSKTDTREKENTAKHNTVTHTGKTPACEEGGWNEYEECTDCEYTTKEIIPPLGHEYGVYVYNNDSTCTRNGTETAKCIRCSETDTREKENTRQQHKTTEQIIREATCTEDGLIREACTECEYTVEKIVPAKGHEYESGVCTECGIADVTQMTVENGIITEINETLGNVTRIVISDARITGIGKLAGRTFGSAEEIITKGITDIGESAFEYCRKLKRIVTDGVKRIGDKAFFECASLTEVFLPETLESLGEDIFLQCDQTVIIHYAGEIAQWNNIAPASFGTSVTVICSDGEIGY